MEVLGPPSSSLAHAASAETENAKLELGGPRGWHSRGYVPHLDVAGVLQSVTFRLADSLPQEKLRQLERELEGLGDDVRDRRR